MSEPSIKPGLDLPHRTPPGRIEPGFVLTPEQKKSRNHRNIAIALAIGFFVVLFYAVTIAKLGPGVLTHPVE